MPSHKIHISIAQTINKYLKLNIDNITLGSVLPDLAIVEHHGISHYQYKDEYPYNLANADEFIKHNKEFINNDISIGYIIHLLTDKFYNEKYYRKFFIFENNKPSKLILDIKDDSLRKKMKHYDFLEYDKYLIDTKTIIPFSKSEFNIPNYKDLKFNNKTIVKYIKKFNKELNNNYGNYDFKYWKKEELDIIYNECVEYILKYLKESKLV